MNFDLSDLKNKGIQVNALHDFSVLHIENELASADICLHGGHVLSYVPAGEKDLLWVSRHSLYTEGKAIRGGIPVCWPWFGSVKSPAHGVARIRNWSLKKAASEADGSTTVVLSLEPAAEGLSAELYVNAGSSLRVELKTVNHGNVPATVTEALHTYFSVGDIEGVQVCGLDGMSYSDKVLNTEAVQCGSIVFDRETDRVYDDTDSVIVIRDSVLNRKICVERWGSNSTIVWNPWIEKAAKMADFGNDEYREMVCVEAANAGRDEVCLPPGASHILGTRIRLIG